MALNFILLVQQKAPGHFRPDAFIFHRNYKSAELCELLDELLSLLPAEARISYRLSVNTLADLLGAILDVGLDHKTLYDFSDALRNVAAVHDILCDTDLLEVFLT